MSIACYGYEVVSFDGDIVEGSNGHIYLYDCLDSYVFGLNGRSVTLVGRLFNERQSKKPNGVKSGYGYIAVCRPNNRYMWRVCTLPSFSKRVVYMSGYTFIGYNAERAAAVLTDHGRSHVVCVDHGCRPARRQKLDMLVQSDSVNIDRLLVGKYNDDRRIEVYDLVSGARVSELEAPANMSYFDYVYPVSADTIISSCNGLTLVKNAQVVFSDSRFRPWDIASRHDRVVARAFVKCAASRTMQHLVYINAKDGNVCTIYNARSAVLLSNGLAVLAETGSDWFIVPYSRLDAERASHITVNPLRQSAVLIENAPTLSEEDRYESSPPQLQGA